MLRDAERRRGKYRNEEWGEPWSWRRSRVHAAATGPQPHQRGGYTVCAIHAADEPDQPLRTGFKALDYRLMTTEPFMIHRLRRIPRVAAPATIRRVRTPELAQRLAKAARSRQILPENLGADAPQRQYVALHDGAIVGWVGSIAVEDATWCQKHVRATRVPPPRHRPRHAVPAVARRPRRRCEAGRAARLAHRGQAVHHGWATARSARCCCSRRPSGRRRRPERAAATRRRVADPARPTAGSTRARTSRLKNSLHADHSKGSSIRGSGSASASSKYVRLVATW